LRPGSARTRWGSFSAPPDPLAAIGGGCLHLRGGQGREWEKGRTGRGREKGEGREGKCKGGNPKVWGFTNYA